MGARPHRNRIADGGPRHARGVDGAEHDPHRHARDRRAAGVDGQRLQPELRGPADHRGRARRSLRPAQAVRDRARALRGGVRSQRAGARCRLADRVARRPGRRIGPDHAAGPRAAERGVPAREAWRGNRHIQRDHRPRGGERPARRRRDRQRARLAVDLLDQRPDRSDLDPVRADQDARGLRAGYEPGHPRPARSRRGSAG